jgi:hypothetical protein
VWSRTPAGLNLDAREISHRGRECGKLAIAGPVNSQFQSREAERVGSCPLPRWTSTCRFGVLYTVRNVGDSRATGARGIKLHEAVVLEPVRCTDYLLPVYGD